MTEVRTTSSTGGQKGVKPERFSLMPTKGLAAIARVFGFGAAKYDAHNWRKGYEWSKSFDALERHFQAAKDGETYDEESGLPHLAHAGFHILVLLTWLEEQGEGADNPFDDRWPAAMERARREEQVKAAFSPELDTSTPLDEPVGERGMLDPEKWQNVGYVDEAFEFKVEDLAEMQEQINRSVRKLADVARMQCFIQRPKLECIPHFTLRPDGSAIQNINDAHNGASSRG